MIWEKNLKKYDIPLAQNNYEEQWIAFYKKYDILNKDERNRTSVHASMENIMLGRTDTKDNFISPSYRRFFDLDKPQTDFQNLCSFLKCFHEK